MSEFLTFTDFNFKLLVIEELMYNQEALEPFSLTDWADEQGIDLDADHFGEVVPGARDYFDKLQIPAELADGIEELLADGGNEVYANICWQWDGEDDTFDVRTVADAAQFPNLTMITLLNPDDVDGVDALRAEGITVEEL